MNVKRLKIRKAQSAMEYLMTYGWAILIIAVVLGALFSLNVFNGGNVVGTACVAGPGWLCSGMVLQGGTTNGGNVMFTFGQSTGATIYNIAMACAATSNTISGYSGQPNPLVSMTCLSSSGAATATPFVPATGCTGATLNSGATWSVSGLPCYGNTGNPPTLLGSSIAIGTPYTGSLWINYTTGSTASLATTLTVKFATIMTKVA